MVKYHDILFLILSEFNKEIMDPLFFKKNMLHYAAITFKKAVIYNCHLSLEEDFFERVNFLLTHLNSLPLKFPFNLCQSDSY